MTNASVALISPSKVHRTVTAGYSAIAFSGLTRMCSVPMSTLGGNKMQAFRRSRSDDLVSLAALMPSYDFPPLAEVNPDQTKERKGKLEFVPIKMHPPLQFSNFNLSKSTDDRYEA